jgi:hypothetical protein
MSSNPFLLFTYIKIDFFLMFKSVFLTFSENNTTRMRRVKIPYSKSVPIKARIMVRRIKVFFIISK